VKIEKKRWERHFILKTSSPTGSKQNSVAPRWEVDDTYIRLQDATQGSDYKKRPLLLTNLVPYSWTKSYEG